MYEVIDMATMPAPTPVGSWSMSDFDRLRASPKDTPSMTSAGMITYVAVVQMARKMRRMIFDAMSLRSRA